MSFVLVSVLLSRVPLSLCPFAPNTPFLKVIVQEQTRGKLVDYSPSPILPRQGIPLFLQDTPRLAARQPLVIAFDRHVERAAQLLHESVDTLRLRSYLASEREWIPYHDHDGFFVPHNLDDTLNSLLGRRGSDDPDRTRDDAIWITGSHADAPRTNIKCHDSAG